MKYKPGETFDHTLPTIDVIDTHCTLYIFRLLQLLTIYILSWVCLIDASMLKKTRKTWWKKSRETKGEQSKLIAHDIHNKGHVWYL